MVSDAVFSVDGALAPVAELHAAAREHGALLVLDEAHAFGVTGPGGRGAAAAGIAAEPELIRTVTRSKALAGQGGAVLGVREVIGTLVATGRGFIFDTGLRRPARPRPGADASRPSRLASAIGRRELQSGIASASTQRRHPRMYAFSQARVDTLMSAEGYGTADFCFPAQMRRRGAHGLRGIGRPPETARSRPRRDTRRTRLRPLKVRQLTSSPPRRADDSSRDIGSRCRFAVRRPASRKPPRAATACPAAVSYWALQVPAWLSRAIRQYCTALTFPRR